MDWDWGTISQVLNYIGFPAIITWFLYDRKRLRAEARKQDASATVAEGKAPNEIRTSSVVSLEAEIVALQKSFDADRRIKDATIDWLSDELDDARTELESKDALIDALKKQVRTLMGEADTIKRRLKEVERELNRARKMGHE